MHSAIAAAGEDGHDVRMVQVGGRLGLVVEAGHLLAVQDRGKRQHFQCHAAVQRYLPGLIDHAHAAAADLPHNRVIAQLPLGPLASRRPSGCGGPQGRGRPVDKIQTCQIGANRTGEIGMSGHKLFSVRGKTKFQFLQVALQEFGQALLDFRRQDVHVDQRGAGGAPARGSRVGEGGGDVQGHVLCTGSIFSDWRLHGVPSSFICRRIWPMARSHNIRTAPVERPICRAMSLKASPSQWRRTSTSR